VAIADPTVSKTSVPLGLAGVDPVAPILKGLKFRVAVDLRAGETVESVVVTATGFQTSIAWTQDEGAVYLDLVAGTNTASAAAGIRNTITVVTNRGTVKRDLWCIDLPTTGALYINNQECQDGEAIAYANVGDANPYANVVSLGVNILPTLEGGFYRQQCYSSNRYANCRKGWGGAATAQISIDGVEVVAETALEHLFNIYWTATSFGVHVVTVVLRAAAGSATTVTITGSLRIRQIPVPA